MQGVLGDGTNQPDLMRQPQRKIAMGQRGLRRRQPAEHGVAAFPVEHLTGREISLGGCGDVGIEAGRNAGRLAATGDQRKTIWSLSARWNLLVCLASHRVHDRELTSLEVSPHSRTRPRINDDERCHEAINHRRNRNQFCTLRGSN